MASSTNTPPDLSKLERNYHHIARDLAWESVGAERGIRLEVISDSMLPLLNPGDKILVQKIDPESLRLGDIVVLRRRGEFITHRLVGRSPDGWITKGDHWRHLDPPVSVEAILGRVTAIERKSTSINFQTRFWRIANWSLGYINWWVGRCFAFLRKCKAWLMGNI